MGVVTIKCPRTGHDILTGIEMNQSEFARAPVFIARAYCSRCRCEHEWFAKDAWVSDSTRQNVAELDLT